MFHDLMIPFVILDWLILTMYGMYLVMEWVLDRWDTR